MSEEAEEEDCLSCRVEVAVGTTDKLCREDISEAKCDEILEEFVNNSITLGNYIKKVAKVSPEADTKEILTLIKGQLKKWQITSLKFQEVEE